jgi:hypothetical protein
MMNSAPFARLRWVLPLFGVLVCLGAEGQQPTIPKPSRTAFKCLEGKRVAYSDAPCVGAERVDLQPTRGLNSSSGKELVGADVRRERNREQVAEAFRPLTGKSNQEVETYGRRMRLTASAKSECSSLDASIPRTEAEERASSDQQRTDVQRRLFGLRTRYRQLGC